MRTAKFRESRRYELAKRDRRFSCFRESGTQRYSFNPKNKNVPSLLDPAMTSLLDPAMPVPSFLDPAMPVPSFLDHAMNG